MKFKHLNNAVNAFRLSKDPKAFNYMYRELSGQLYYLCLRYVKNDADAQDILQETFISAFRKIDLFTGSGSFEGWIKRIAVNNCLQKLKADQKHFVFNEALPEKNNYVQDDELYVDKEETEAKLLKALHALPDGYRTILNLAILEDYSHRDIGLLLGISESTSRSQLSRARIALKEKLNQL